jgi:hypothetical protein
MVTGYDSTTAYQPLVYYYDWDRREEEPSLDRRKDPKAWALWFREFLKLLYPVRELVEAAIEPEFYAKLEHRCRAGTLPAREWKMKNWIQALERA